VKAADCWVMTAAAAMPSAAATTCLRDIIITGYNFSAAPASQSMPL
jgi:hypothetical protein